MPSDPAPRQGPLRRTGARRVNDFDLVRKNLFRRKLRAALMIVSILIAFMIFGVLAGFHRAFTVGEDRAAADRLITVNKINFTQPMPIAYFNRVRAVDGVRQVTHANWFGGYYQDPKNFVMSLAIEPATYFDVYRNEFDVPPDQLSGLHPRPRQRGGRRKAGAEMGLEDRRPHSHPEQHLQPEAAAATPGTSPLPASSRARSSTSTPTSCCSSTPISTRPAVSARTPSAG